jgi:hypothetical protein
VARDQPQPGSFLHKKEEPGNEVVKSLAVIPSGYDALLTLSERSADATSKDVWEISERTWPLTGGNCGGDSTGSHENIDVKYLLKCSAISTRLEFNFRSTFTFVSVSLVSDDIDICAETLVAFLLILKTDQNHFGFRTQPKNEHWTHKAWSILHRLLYSWKHTQIVDNSS